MIIRRAKLNLRCQIIYPILFSLDIVGYLVLYQLLCFKKLNSPLLLNFVTSEHQLAGTRRRRILLQLHLPFHRLLPKQAVTFSFWKGLRLF